jgi:threonine dehydratase
MLVSRIACRSFRALRTSCAASRRAAAAAPVSPAPPPVPPPPSPLPASIAAGSSSSSAAPADASDESPVAVSFGDVAAASLRIRGAGGVQRTAVHLSRKLSPLLNPEGVSGGRLVLKAEYSHETGSFKERGGRNALLQLSAGARSRGVIAASAGNHALALAFHGRELGIPVTVVMPTIAPLTKVANCRMLGADVRVQGAHIGEARDVAMALLRERGLTYINGFDHPDVIAGAGTMGLELLEQVPDVAAVVVPCGGGGLVAGVALAVKTLRPEVRIIAAEPASVPSMAAAFDAGRPVTVAAGATLADGLLVPRVGTNAFALARAHVDRVVAVSEHYIALAMLRLLEEEKVVVEGGGAVGLAAIMQGLLPELAGKTVVLPLCGGNVDTPLLGRVLERGLAADGRLVRISTAVSDRPGGIAALTKVLAELGTSIKDIYHK